MNSLSKLEKLLIVVVLILLVVFLWQHTLG